MTRGTSIKYTDAELEWIKQRRTWNRKKAHRKFCEKFQRSDVSFENFCALCQRKGWSTGRDGRFEKGMAPANKGKKMPYNANRERTQFKKGNLPHNTRHLGHERVGKDGYVEISIDEINPHTGFERRYVLKHKYLWEKEHGKLPAGMCLKCLDGNRQNTDPSNWQAIPRGALPFLNGHRGHDYETAPAELKPTVLALAKVKHAVGKKKKRARQMANSAPAVPDLAP